MEELSWPLIQMRIDDELQNGIDARFIREAVNDIQKTLKAIRQTSLAIGKGYSLTDGDLKFYVDDIEMLLGDLKEECAEFDTCLSMITMNVDRSLCEEFGYDYYDIIDADTIDIKHRVFVTIGNEYGVYL